jgi:hypothetical protein
MDSTVTDALSAAVGLLCRLWSDLTLDVGTLWDTEGSQIRPSQIEDFSSFIADKNLLSEPKSDVNTNMNLSILCFAKYIRCWQTVRVCMCVCVCVYVCIYIIAFDFSFRPV